jgi:hypothetical protein
MKKSAILCAVLLLSAAATGQVRIKEHVSINPRLGHISSSVADPDAPYNGKIIMKIPGRLHFFWWPYWVESWWFGPPVWVSGCHQGCGLNMFGYGPIIRLEAPYAATLYDGSASYAPYTPGGGCGDVSPDCGRPLFAHDMGMDLWMRDSLEFELGPFNAGDEITINVGPSGCQDLRYYAQQITLTAQNNYGILNYRLDKGRQGSLCPEFSPENLDWINSVSNTDLRWLDVEVVDPPPSVPTYLVASYSPSQIDQCEIATLNMSYLDQCGEEYWGGVDGTFDVKVTQGKDSVCLVLLSEIPSEYTDVVLQPDEFHNVPAWAYVGIRLKQRFPTLTEFKTEVTARVYASSHASKVSMNGPGQTATHIRKSIAGKFSRNRATSPVPKKISASHVPKLSSPVQEEGITATAAVNAKPGSCLNEIMLGETKYYQAIQDPEWDDNLLFNEYKLTTERVNTGLGDVKYTVEILEGDKLGVYYDEYIDEQGDNLENDIIRLIGRYWDAEQPEKPYIVKLTAEAGDKYGETFIEVTKPVKLLTPGQSPTYRLSRDVFNNEINIDEICIEYGGKYGVPPHFLKGQMLREAATADFGYTGFAPTYRYEPFTAQFWGWQGNERYSSGPWYVDPSRVGREMGTGKDVPMHQNVYDIQYSRSPRTLWDIVYDHTELVNVDASKGHQYYGNRNEDGTMNFSDKYKEVYGKYQVFLTVARLQASLSKKTVGEISREYMIRWLRDTWRGGAKNLIAQTRLASSYGLLQIMYSTAVDFIGYPSNDPQASPEDINVTNTCLNYSLEYMKKSLQNNLTPSVESIGNWPKGFEYYFKEYIWPTWNTGDGYSEEVYVRTQRFLPQNQ